MTQGSFIEQSMAVKGRAKVRVRWQIEDTTPETGGVDLNQSTKFFDKGDLKGRRVWQGRKYETGAIVREEFHWVAESR